MSSMFCSITPALTKSKNKTKNWKKKFKGNKNYQISLKNTQFRKHKQEKQIKNNNNKKTQQNIKTFNWLYLKIWFVMLYKDT